MTKEEAEVLLSRYSARAVVIDNSPRGWNYLTVEVLLDGEVVGSYQRNYPNLFNAFQPFVHADQHGEYHVLALYSRHYTGTRLMRLPDCVDIGGEEPVATGFCPKGYLVPYAPEQGLMGRFGFVSGCQWGDDSSDKLQFLDLSKASKGLLARDDRFGYLELPWQMPLKDAVRLECYKTARQTIEIQIVRQFNLSENRFVDSLDE